MTSSSNIILYHLYLSSVLIPFLDCMALEVLNCYILYQIANTMPRYCADEIRTFEILMRFLFENESFIYLFQ